MAREEKYTYNWNSAPTTPLNKEGYEEKKKKRGLKKLISLTTKKLNPNNLDKPPISAQRKIEKDEGGESQSRRKSFSGFFKLPRSSTSKNDDTKSQGATSPSRPSILASPLVLIAESYKENIEGLLEQERVEVVKEETKPANILLTEKIGEESKVSKTSEEVSRIDEPYKLKEDKEVKVIGNMEQEKEVVVNDEHQNHKHIEDSVKKEESGTIESKAAQEKSQDPDSPHTENFGCESIAKGLQHICLPWTIKKEDHY